MTLNAEADPPVLAVEGLRVAFDGPASTIMAANGVSLTARRSRTLGVVGESGSGKSVTLRALCGLLPSSARIVAGSITVFGEPCSWDRDLARIRGTVISMIFQDPTASLNPVRQVGDQLCEVLRVKLGMSKRAANRRAVELLDHVGIPDAPRRVRAYAHELSGGMRQRIMIALAIAPQPKLLLADEPTTALDVTTQKQILELLRGLQYETGMAIIFVTHDLAVVADVCDDVLVMYAGYVVDRGTVERVTKHPSHPYTQGLVAAMPKLYGAALPRPIPGQPPDMALLPRGCPFAPRCPQVRRACQAVVMATEIEHACACPFARQADAVAAPL